MASVTLPAGEKVPALGVVKLFAPSGEGLE
jgi:hypothetical protein